jgi:hypothetical protein
MWLLGSAYPLPNHLNQIPATASHSWTQSHLSTLWSGVLAAPLHFFYLLVAPMPRCPAAPGSTRASRADALNFGMR